MRKALLTALGVFAAAVTAILLARHFSGGAAAAASVADTPSATATRTHANAVLYNTGNELSGLTGLKYMVYNVADSLSMAPMFGKTASVLVEGCGFSSVRPGDVVVFDREGRLIIHAVAVVEQDRLWTRGWNTAVYDPYWVTEEMFIGRLAGCVYHRGEW